MEALMESINMESIARKVVRDCLLLKEGEHFWISCADDYYTRFALHVAGAAVEAGAHPIVTVSSDGIARKKYDNSFEYLQSPPVYFPALVNASDAMLILAFPRDPACLQDVPPERLAAVASSQRASHDAVMERNRDRVRLRQSSFLYPTPEAAGRYGIPFEEYHDLVWGAVDIDYHALSQRARAIASLITAGERVRITGDGGTDLTFSIKGRPALIDDGVMDEEDMANGTYIQNLPSGEVYVAPVEDSAEGTALFQYNVFNGRPLVNFRVRFHQGRIVEMQADEGLEHYRGIMEMQTGEKYRICELGFGLNPRVTKITGELALDEKIIGTVHIATGENRMFTGGTNEASIHWDMVMKNPTLSIDGRVIMEKGEYPQAGGLDQ
jgi:aminopeptidase